MNPKRIYRLTTLALKMNGFFWKTLLAKHSSYFPTALSKAMEAYFKILGH